MMRGMANSRDRDLTDYLRYRIFLERRFRLQGEPTMNGVNSSGASEVIRVKRDPIIHSWAMAVGDQWMPLPWKETADAVSVVLWVKERSDRAVQVHVEL
jgi:hypothetical protein